MARVNYWKKVVLISVVGMLGLAVGVQAEPKNVIFLIGDGMGPEQVKAGGMYAWGAAGTLSFESFPYNGELTTYSANASITDSAAAATALATGFKVNNGVISIALPGDHSELETLLEYSQTLDKSTGLVTTTYMAHATPAAFGAHEPSRSNYSQIANDYLTQTRPNVLFGGNSYMGGASGAGYTVATDAAGMFALDTEAEAMVSGQFGSGYMPYEYDGLGVLPHLSEMTAVALDLLDKDPDGFFLMVEGGRIDHAGHLSNSDPDKTAYMVWEVIEFANAVQEAIDWAAGRTDTLIIVTADHETGGLTVTGNNGQYEYPSVTWSSTGHTAANVPVYAWGVNAELISGVMDNTDMFGVVTATISPKASNPSPTDTATDVSITADLNWTAGVGATEHYVYLWYEVDFQQVYVVNGDVTYEPTYILDVLAPATTYYWQIDEFDGTTTHTGTVWSFQTSAAPGQASNPSPTGTDVGVDSDLSWTAGSDTTSHDVYFGINPTPGVAEFQGNQPGATFDPVMDYVTTYYWRIDEVGPGGVTAGEVWSFTTVVAAPGQASNPSPTGTDVPIDADLNWDAGEGATSHDVYFGATSPGEFQGNQMETTFDPDTMMANDTTYYWRIDEKNAGGTTTGTVWSFTTVVAAPGQASSPNPPADGAESVAIDADLSWTAGAGATSHDVYFGITSPGEFQGNQTGTTYEPGLLNPGTPYYWRIDEVGPGGITTGAVWSFTTTPAETAYDAYVSQEPIVTFGEVEGTIQGTIEADDDLVQEITEVPDGHPLNGSLQVEYVLHTAANRTDITELTLYLDLTWTGLDAGDPLISEIGIWNGTDWTNITASIGGSYTPANPHDYVNASGDIRVRFTDTQAVKKENKDTLTVDLLYAHVAAGPPDTTPPAAPTGLGGTGADLDAQLSWNANSEPDVAGYRVYRSTTAGGGYSLLTPTLVAGTSYADPVGAEGTYYYVITAEDGPGNESTYSAEAAVTVTDVAPAAPTGLAATPGDSQATLDWADNTESDITGYNVYRSETAGGSYTKVNGSLLPTSDYVDLGLVNGITYFYVVTAVDTATPTALESGYSSEVSATPTAQVSDVITIVKAEYRTRRQVLTVQATSSQGGVAVLLTVFDATMTEIGTMTYDGEEYQYQLRLTGVADPGATVTVVSDLGGSETGPVVHRN